VVAVAAPLFGPVVAADGSPRRVQTIPRLGQPDTIFTTFYKSLGSEAFGSDYVFVNGPRGTACEDTIISGAVGYAEGTQRIDMGPGVTEGDAGERHYRFRPYYFEDEDEERPIKRWCPGLYHGGVYFEHEDRPKDDLHTVFSFRVESPRVSPVPRAGGTLTTFVVRWTTLTDSDNAGEQFRVYGPPRTRCAGLVAYSPVGFSGGRQTARVGPRASGRGERLFSIRPEDPDPEGRSKPLARWCRGVYRGRVDYENADGEVEDFTTRFRFRVR
jgi:hypothetical protein